MDDFLNVLIVDDDSLFLEYVSTILLNKFNVNVFGANDSLSMTDKLANRSIDCVILDYNLGVETGLRIGELIKNKYSDPPPIIMLTGEGGERTIIKAFRGGFSDFVSKKNLNFGELVAAIRGAVERKKRERSDRCERNRLARLSSFDSTTGLYTASFMKERLDELAASASRTGVPCGVLVIRLDQLESIGDKFGHVMRDRALQAFAARLRTATNENEICGQNRQHSFLYLIEREASLQALSKACERLSTLLSFEANFEAASFSFSPNIGAALSQPDGTNVEEWLAAAETACESARVSGSAFAMASPLPAEPSAAETLKLTGAHPIVREIPSVAPSCSIADRQTDRRTESRRRVLKRGKILLKGHESVVDCMLRDLSTRGARLRLNHLYVPPDRFELLIVDSGKKQLVEVRWRSGDDIGVQFLA